MIESGRTSSLEFQVTRADTAQALGSGDVQVLATPRLLAWAEAATVAALQGSLPRGQTTVGTAVEISHLRPSRIGEQVTVRAEVTAVTDRSVEFRVTATNPGGATAMRGCITRAIVERSRFS